MRTPIVTSLALLTAVGLIGTGFLLAQRTPAAIATDNVDTEIAAAAKTNTAAPATPPMHWGGRHGAHLEEQAALFNMSVDDLQKELAAGKPMYQIAAEHDVTYDKVKSDRLAQVKTRLDDMVAKGFMTQAQADDELKKSENLPLMGAGGHHGFGRMMK